MTFPFSIGISGGGTYAFLQTAIHLKAKGAYVTVMPLKSSGLKTFLRSPVSINKEGRNVENTLRHSGIHVIPVHANRLTYIFDPFSMQKAVAEYVSRYEVDVVISWHHEGAFLGKICQAQNIMFACRASGFYKKIPNHPKSSFWQFLTKQMLKRTFSQANIIWATSIFTRNEVLKVFKVDPQLVKVVPEGINPIFRTAERRIRENNLISRFLFFGIWSRNKGLFDALDAFKIIVDQGYTNWQFHVAGWGNKENVLKVIKDHDLTGQVKILGKLEHEYLIKALEWSDVVLLPSYIESFGLAVAEAQASGVPVIAYDAGAVSELIDNGTTGWLVPPDRTDLLAQAIIESINNPEKTFRMGLAGREKVGGCFSWSNTVQQILGNIENAIT